MRAVKRTEAGIEVVDVPAPDPGVGDVVVNMAAAGICGTDLKLAAFGPSPFTIGHELAGVLEDGTPVAIEPSVGCNECDQCVRGRYNTCRRPGIVGITRDGGMAEQVTFPSSCLVPLPAGVAVRDASLVEPLAVAVHGLRIGGAEPGMKVAVVGGGAIGLCTIAAAVAMGCTVGLSARHPHQREAGERLGAGTAERNADLVAECAGGEAAMADAAHLATPGGTVLILSSEFDKIVLPGLRATMAELRFVVSLAYNRTAAGRDIDDAAALLAATPALGATLITHRFPLEDAASAFAAATDRASGAIKVVIEP